MTKINSKSRLPLTIDELKRLTPSDLMSLKLTDHEIQLLREINKDKERERQELSIRLKIEEQSILRDLNDAGVKVGSVWDLVNLSSKYTDALPVLVKHLLLPYSDVTRGGIARALAVPEAKSFWAILMDEYKKEPSGTSGLGAKQGLACALSVCFTDEDLPEYLDLLKNKSHGESRILLLEPLKRRRHHSPLISQIIEELESDPDLKTEIASWKRKVC